MSVLVAPGPFIGEIAQSEFLKLPADLLDHADKLLADISGLSSSTDPLKAQIKALKKNTDAKILELPDFTGLAAEQKLIEPHKSQPDAQKILEVISLIRKAFSLQRFRHQNSPVDNESRVNFSKLLNARIDPITKEGVRSKHENPSGDFKTTAQYMAAFENFLTLPFSLLDECGFKSTLKPLVERGEYKEVANLVSAYLIDNSRGILSTMLSFIPEDKHINVMTIFGGLTNAISTEMALVKVALDKVSDEFDGAVKENLDKFNSRLAEVFDSLSHTSGQFSRIHAKTLKLIENMNGNMSNQDEPYEFDANNFEIVNHDDKTLLLPTAKFLGDVIKLSNDNSTSVKSQTVAQDHYTKIVEEANFAQDYSKTKGCPFSDPLSSQDARNLSESYFGKIKPLIREIFIAKP